MLDLDTDAVGVVVVDCVVTVFVLLEADAELALLQSKFDGKLIVDSKGVINIMKKRPQKKLSSADPCTSIVGRK